MPGTLCIELHIAGRKGVKVLEMVASMPPRENTLRHSWSVMGGSLTPSEVTDVTAAVNQLVYEWLLYALGSQLPLWTEDGLASEDERIKRLFRTDDPLPSTQISPDSSR